MASSTAISSATTGSPMKSQERVDGASLGSSTGPTAALISISTTGDSNVISVQAKLGLRLASGSCALAVPCRGRPLRRSGRCRRPASCAVQPTRPGRRRRVGGAVAAVADHREAGAGGTDRDHARGQPAEQRAGDDDRRDRDEQAEGQRDADVGVQDARSRPAARGAAG